MQENVNPQPQKQDDWKSRSVWTPIGAILTAAGIIGLIFSVPDEFRVAMIVVACVAFTLCGLLYFGEFLIKAMRKFGALLPRWATGLEKIAPQRLGFLFILLGIIVVSLLLFAIFSGRFTSIAMEGLADLSGVATILGSLIPLLLRIVQRNLPDQTYDHKILEIHIEQKKGPRKP